MCGENDDSYPRAHVRLGSPPRVRGKSLFALVKTVEGRITPACAGKILTTPAIRCPIVDHPRVCGENMGGASKKEASPGSPPRVRGKWDGDYMDKRSFGITPACAGKITRMTRRVILTRDHPRVCGENGLLKSSFATDKGSPPRVRGKCVDAINPLCVAGITPACAGKIGLAGRAHPSWWDHPRVCGENRWERQREWQRGGSPPRVRGKSISRSS